MRIILSILLSVILVGCMETDARVLQLQEENAILKAKQDEVLELVDSIEVVLNIKTLEITNLNATIQAKDDSFDSLMTLWNEKLMDTTYVDSLKNRLVDLLEEYK